MVEAVDDHAGGERVGGAQYVIGEGEAHGFGVGVGLAAEGCEEALGDGVGGAFGIAAEEEGLGGAGLFDDAGGVAGGGDFVF